MSSQPVVTRFAPSPTGYLHVGGARTALFNYLLARNQGGRFLLRIEDTDLARSTKQACDQLLDDLRWLGLDWDNPELVFQSKRQEVYNRAIDGLMKRDLAYEAWETPAELDALRKEAEKQKKAFLYRRRSYTAEQVSRFKAEGRTPVIRFATPVKEYRFQDVVLDKEVVLPADEVQDFVIRKADGMPTYHFAVVVDDAEMSVTHVLRGQEHLKNTFLHLGLQEALSYSRPVYAHLTTIQNLDGSKMGKRDRDKVVRNRAKAWIHQTKGDIAALAMVSGLRADRLQPWLADDKKQLDLGEQESVARAVGLKASELPEILVHDFRKNGYLPEALLNFIALLGWSPGGDRERMSMDEMIKLFSLDRVGVANPKFGRDKLLAFNTEACAAATPQRLLAAFKDFLAANPDSPVRDATDEQLARLLAMKKGFRTLREVEELSRFFFIPDDRIEYDPAAVDKVLRKGDGEGGKALREVRDVLASCIDWSHAALESAVKQYSEGKGLGLGKVAQPVRVAISGSTVSPPIFESLEFLGKSSSLTRIDRCLMHLQ